MFSLLVLVIKRGYAIFWSHFNLLYYVINFILAQYKRQGYERNDYYTPYTDLFFLSFTTKLYDKKLLISNEFQLLFSSFKFFWIVHYVFLFMYIFSLDKVLSLLHLFFWKFLLNLFILVNTESSKYSYFYDRILSP